MGNVRRFVPALFALCVAACGGGGGGTSGGGGVVPTPAPTVTTPGFVAATGAITLIPGSGGTLGSNLLPASADGVFVAQVPTTPTLPPGGTALTQYAVTVKETAGTTPSSGLRVPAADRVALVGRIAENHAIVHADGLREVAIDATAVRRAFSTLRVTSAAASIGRRPLAAPTPGAVRQFAILTSNIGNAGGCAGNTTSGTYQCNVPITATLKAVSQHGNVWIDQKSLNYPGEFANADADAQTIAANFDRYYATEGAAFGPAWNAQLPPVVPAFSTQHVQCAKDGSDLPSSQYTSVDLSGSTTQSIDIVITDALAGTGEGGYYYTVNELPQSVWDCATPPKPISNGRPMVVITGNNYQGLGASIPQFNETYWLNTDVPRSLSHELQHLLHAHNKVLFPAFAGSAPTFDATFIDEGCSMLAEDLATDPAPGQHLDTPRYTYTYLLEPSLFSLTAFTGYQPNPTSATPNTPYGWYSNTAGSYGQAYLFQRYLYDRFGAAALKAIYASTASGVGPVVAAANGEPFAQLQLEFAAAIAAQSSPASASPYAFSSAVTLRGDVDVPSIRPGALSTRHLTFGGPQPPESFGNVVPVAGAALAPGTTLSTFIVDGGTLFLPAVNGATGASIVVNGTGFPLSAGALVQGALPTPAPASR